MCYLLLCSKLPQNVVAENNRHLLSPSCYGSGIWAWLSRVPLPQELSRGCHPGGGGQGYSPAKASLGEALRLGPFPEVVAGLLSSLAVTDTSFLPHGPRYRAASNQQPDSLRASIMKASLCNLTSDVTTFAGFNSLEVSPQDKSTLKWRG